MDLAPRAEKMSWRWTTRVAAGGERFPSQRRGFPTFENCGFCYQTSLMADSSSSVGAWRAVAELRRARARQGKFC